MVRTILCSFTLSSCINVWLTTPCDYSILNTTVNNRVVKHTQSLPILKIFEFCTLIQNIELVVTINVGCDETNSGFHQNKLLNILPI